MPDLPAVFADASAPGLVRLDAPTATEDLAEAAAGHGWVSLVVVLTGATDKPTALERFAEAGRFPGYIGRNWDALQDALGDLSWLGPADGYLVVLEGWDGFAAVAPADARTAESVLAAAAGEWSDRGTPFAALVA